MNRKLTDAQIVSAFEGLHTSGARPSGRALRAALQRRYGATGKTERVFALFRALSDPNSRESVVVADLRCALLAAEDGRAAAQAESERALARAQRSEAREIAHQDRWANEIHTLRQGVEELKVERARRHSLEDQVLHLQRSLQELQRQLAKIRG